MNIAILIFDRITVLDAVGPYEVLSRLPDAKVSLVGPRRGEVRTDNRALGLVADLGIDDVQATDLLLVPGGYGERLLERDDRVLRWLQAIDRVSQLTTSVCTGALLLGAAGLLRGRRATTHWALHHRLGDFGAIPTAQRVVRDGKYATAAGVSAGIDLALALAIEIAGEETAARIQLSIEYDPDPPLDAGDAARAPADRRRAILDRVRSRDAEMAAPP